jgi:hypothetical protein
LQPESTDEVFTEEVLGNPPDIDVVEQRDGWKLRAIEADQDRDGEANDKPKCEDSKRDIIRLGAR